MFTDTTHTHSHAYTLPDSAVRLHSSTLREVVTMQIRVECLFPSTTGGTTLVYTSTCAHTHTLIYPYTLTLTHTHKTHRFKKPYRMSEQRDGLKVNKTLHEQSICRNEFL